MINKHIGIMMQNERIRQGLTMEELCDGLCNKTTVYKMELDGKLPDYLTFQALLTRLGKSTAYCRFILLENEYTPRLLQIQMEQKLWNQDYTEIDEMLETYRMQFSDTSRARKQYYYLLMGVLEKERNRNTEKAIEYITMAINETAHFNFSRKSTHNYLWSKIEWILQLYHLELRLENSRDNVYAESKILLDILERKTLDSELRSDLFTKAVWLFCKCAPADTKEIQLHYITQVIDDLTGRGRLTYLPAMMRLYIQLLGEFDYHEKEALWKKHLDALKFAYQLAEISFPERDLCIWRQYHNNDIFLFSELVYQERTNHSQTQDELAAAIKKDNKTISRIERNANSPKRETAKKLLDALDVPHNLFGSDIYADTYSVLETADQISYCITNGDAITGSHLLQKIKAEISIDIPVNHQYIESTELQLTNMISPMNPSEMIKRLIACFEITHPFNVLSFPNLTLSEQEVIIATQIANCERELHNSSKAVLILESMLAGFDSSKIPEYLHSASLKIILGRLKDFCETSGLFEDAKKYCMRDLILQLKCEHGLALPTIILQWFYIMEREKQPAEAYKIGYQQAYQLFLLMKKNTYLNTIKTHYFGIFGSEIQ